MDEKGPEVVVLLAAASMKQAQETLSKTNKIGNLGEEHLYQPAFLPDSACDGNEKAPNFQPRGQSQGPPNQESGPGGAHQGPPQGQQPPRGGPGGADTQAPPPASTPPQGPPSLGHNGPPAPQQQQQQSQQPPQGPPAHSGPPSGTSTLTRERKRIPIIDPTTRQEVSVDGTSADKKKSKQSQGEGKKKAKKANSSKKKKQAHPLQNLMKTIKNIPGFSIPRTTIRRVLR